MEPDDFDPTPDEPLLEAVRRGDLEEVRAQAAAAPGELDLRGSAHGLTALELALALGRVEIARALLDAGANPDDRSPDGETALGLAARRGPPELVELLLGRGALPGRSALMDAARAGTLAARVACSLTA